MNFNFNLETQKEIKKLFKITDKDFGIEEKKNKSNPEIRIGARGMIFNEDGKIAIIHKKNKNEYKLPGGGVEENEDPKESFLRECLEEIGCEVCINNFLGVAEEYKSQENFKQFSYVFIAKKTLDKNELKLTKKEMEEGTEFIWLDVLEALNRMKNSLNTLKASNYDNIYRSKFMVLRDIKILENYINSSK